MDPGPLLAKSNEVSPSNAANPYDYVGHIHNELLYAYYKTAHQPHGIVSVMERLDSIGSEHIDFVNLASNGYMAPDTAKVAFILEHQITCVAEIIALSGLSLKAKSTLSTFISSVLAFSTAEDDYAVIYSFIVAYEKDVQLDNNFDVRDKEVLLSLSSLARHSLYAKKKRPKKNMDPDWDVLISNIIGSTEGALESQATAIMYGLVAGIVEN